MGPKKLNAVNDPGLHRDTRAQDAIRCPSPSPGTKLLVAFFVCARGGHILSPPLLSHPLLQLSVLPFNFFFRLSSRLCNLIKCISCFLLVFSFKSTAGISGLKKGLPKRELICFFSVASGLIKDTPSFYRPQWKKSNLHL